jgi:hypothetical protein
MVPLSHVLTVETAPKIEEVSDDDSDEEGGDAKKDEDEKGKPSRSEKKARKVPRATSKLSL